MPTPSLKIASWNINSLKIRHPQVSSWLTTNNCDVLCLQETKQQDKNFIKQPFLDSGYQLAYSGQKAYNGVALISKYPISEVSTDIPGLIDNQRRIIAATINSKTPLRLINLYVVNGKAVGEPEYYYKLQWLNKVKQYIRQQLTIYPQLLVVGDFNIAMSDKDVYDADSYRDRILCSKLERETLQKIYDLGISDLYPQHNRDIEFSWWDYRFNKFAKNQGLRIDLILGNQQMANKCKACYIDSQPRHNDRPSDHAPVVAEFNL